MTTTSDLFQPRELDVPGSELAETIAAIEARGGVIVAMDVVSVSGYKLSIAWPNRGDLAKPVDEVDFPPAT